MNAYNPMRLSLVCIALAAFVADNFSLMLLFTKRQPHAG